MAKLLITTEDSKVIEVQGRMTFEVNKIENEEGELVYITSGQLSMHNYIEGIVSIESARYKLNDIEIIREVFGTNDFDILYEFILTDAFAFEVKKDTLAKEAIKRLEDEQYKKDDSVAWDIWNEVK